MNPPPWMCKIILCFETSLSLLFLEEQHKSLLKKDSFSSGIIYLIKELWISIAFI